MHTSCMTNLPKFKLLIALHLDLVMEEFIIGMYLIKDS
jgi:hypothetical protein